MGVYDQCARYAARSDPEAVVQRLLRSTMSNLVFVDWFDTRSLPKPDSPERIADLIAILDNSQRPNARWLIVFEFQSKPNRDKIYVLAEQSGMLLGRARYGENKNIPWNVSGAYVHLTGRPEVARIDSTLPDGSGNRYVPLVWNLEDDDAVETLERVADGRMSWGMLFWIPLMRRGSDLNVIGHWKDLVAGLPAKRIRGDLNTVVTFFAELAGNALVWKKQLKGETMTESPILNELIRESNAETELRTVRAVLLDLLKVRFEIAIPEDVVSAIESQPSLAMLRSWIRKAGTLPSMEAFIQVLRQ